MHVHFDIAISLRIKAMVIVDGEFKAMIIRILTGLRKRMEDTRFRIYRFRKSTCAKSTEASS